MALTVNKLGDYFNSGQKIASALGAIIFIISSITLAYYKINQTAIFQENLKTEMIHRFEDERETNNKLRTRIIELEGRVNKDEVQDAYHRGRSDAIEEYLKDQLKSK